MHNFSMNRMLKIFVLVVMDMLCAGLAAFLGVLICSEYSAVPHLAIKTYCRVLEFWLPLHLLVFMRFRLYNRLWKFASVIEALRVITAALISSILLLLLGSLIGLATHKSCYLIIWFFLTALTLGTRFSYRILQAVRQIKFILSPVYTSKKIMIIGAGYAGNALIREIERDSLFSGFRVVCLIDDDAKKMNRYIGNAKVVGNREKIVWATEYYHVDEIIFAIPSASLETRHEFFTLCLDTSCVIRTLPSYYQMVTGKVSISMLRKVEITDLLERPQINLELEDLSRYIRGKKILITGAGGSIGSELCRQLAKGTPGQLLLFDIYENSVYFVQNELKEKYPQLDIVTLIGSVRDVERLDYIFSVHKPDIVYHAAAHKHVPLMEGSPNEAVKNNVFGTLNLACVADKYGVSRFVMISTDKAVNPTNVMGATKRICELVIQYYDKHSKTQFVAVRFGNVLGSNGSVIPIFRKQIESGGPVTVTHPDIIRYFMTIPEAVSLVLQAGTYARGGEIFVLDMGDPVKVLTLAENMIRLSGLVPYKDINIKFTGLRPGEKIYEELLMDEEGIAETRNKKIFIGKPLDLNEDIFKKQLERLKHEMDDESYDIRILLREIVPSYHFSREPLI